MNFIGFGAMDVTRPYEFIGLVAMDVTNPYEFIGLVPWMSPNPMIFLGLGAMDVTKPYEFIGFGTQAKAPLHQGLLSWGAVGPDVPCTLPGRAPEALQAEARPPRASHEELSRTSFFRSVTKASL